MRPVDARSKLWLENDVAVQRPVVQIPDQILAPLVADLCEVYEIGRRDRQNEADLAIPSRDAGSCNCDRTNWRYPLCRTALHKRL